MGYFEYYIRIYDEMNNLFIVPVHESEQLNLTNFVSLDKRFYLEFGLPLSRWKYEGLLSKRIPPRGHR